MKSNTQNKSLVIHLARYLVLEHKFVLKFMIDMTLERGQSLLKRIKFFSDSDLHVLANLELVVSLNARLIKERSKLRIHLINNKS